MPTEELEVELRDDFVKRQTSATPVNALAELIWNGLDEDATRVTVSLERSAIGKIERIIVADNGNGIDRGQIRSLFGGLGGSWKKTRSTTRRFSRELHGKEGRGRFKAFSLGRTVDWDTTYEKGGKLHSYRMSILEDDIRKVRLENEAIVAKGKTGTKVVISDITGSLRALDQEGASQDLAEIFALYLKNYRNVKITYDGDELDPDALIAEEWTFPLADVIGEDGSSYPATLKIVEWKKKTTRSIYLCNGNGFPLQPIQKKVPTGDLYFTAYICSEYLQKLSDENFLAFADTSKEVSPVIDDAVRQLKELYRERSAERARSYVDRWKADDVYPYAGEPSTDLDRIERQIFEMVAVTVQEASPSMESVSSQQLAMHLSMLKVAIEHSPSDLQKILTEVVRLPQAKVKELAELLEDTPLVGVINAAKLVTERLEFLEALEVILFRYEERKRLKERTQLHKILETNTWIFGEEFNLWVSDKGLTNVLRSYAKHLDTNVVVDEPVKPPYRKIGIVDLVLSRQLQLHRADEFENLVIELKAPAVTLNNSHYAQLEEYAFAVSQDDRFHTVSGVRWHFWLVGDSYDEVLGNKLKGGNDPARRIIHKDDRVSIGVKTWAEILSENSARLQFIKDRLERTPDEDKSLSRVEERYKRFLAGVRSSDTKNDEPDVEKANGD